MNCRKCKTEMTEGLALSDILSGIPDFLGSSYVCTVSPSGEAEMKKVLKCPSCGWSYAPATVIEDHSGYSAAFPKKDKDLSRQEGESA